MDDIFLRKQDIEDKLEEERRRSEMIKDSLAKAQMLTDNMVTILNQFDDRLHTLEDTILPVHRKTKDLQRLQDNIEKTTAALDNVISYHHVVHDVEVTMRQGPSRQVDGYLSCMEQLEKSILFFSENNPDSPELNAVNTLFVSGKDSLEKEFQAQLSRQTKIFTPDIITDLEPSDLSSEDIYQYLSEKSIASLSKIAQWLYGPGKTRGFMKIYSNIRSNNFVQSLERLKENAKHKAAGGVTKKVGNIGGTPRKPGARRASNFARKTSTLLRKESLQSLSSVGGIGKSSFAPISEEDVVDVEIEPFLAILEGCLRILMVEKLIIQNVMPEFCRRKVFDTTIKASLDLLVNDGNKCVQFAKQCITRRDHPSVVTIFPILKRLKEVFPLYMEILETSESGKMELRQLISDLESNGVKLLQDFTDCIKSDPEKESKMPKDGIVHELTSNAMLFMQQLAQNAEVSGGMLASQQKEPAKKCLSIYICEVLAALKLNLKNKSRVYVDQSLASVFLLNNFHFILTALNRHDLLFLVQLTAGNIETIYNESIDEQKFDYLRCWDKVAAHLSDEGRGNLSHVHAGMKLKDKDKQAVKEKFRQFNNEFEDLVKTHQQWAMPSSDVKREIRASVKQKIVAPYAQFNNKYRMVQFTKNIEKYLKYTAESVEENLDRLFDQCTT